MSETTLHPTAGLPNQPQQLLSYIYTYHMSPLKLYFHFITQIFSPRRWPVFLLAIITTSVLVFSGLDWMYFNFVLSTMPTPLLFIADIFGYLFPTSVILGLLVLGYMTRNKLYSLYVQASIYAITLGFTLSMGIKIFTGRTSPPHSHRGEPLVLIDNSRAWDFGFLQEQIMGGWPSSHATVSFALVTTLIILLPPRLYIRLILAVTALFIGIGVTFGFHWLSEFIAGSTLGIVIGLVVGTYFKKIMTPRV